VVSDTRGMFGSWLLCIGIMGLERMFVYFSYIRRYVFHDIKNKTALERRNRLIKATDENQLPMKLDDNLLGGDKEENKTNYAVNDRPKSYRSGS